MLRRLMPVVLLASFVACEGDDHHHGSSSSPALPPPPPGTLDVAGPALYVALGKGGGVAVVVVAAWKLAGTIALSDRFFPHHLALSPQRDRIAVAAPAADLSEGHDHAGHEGQGESALYVVDARTGGVLAQRKVAAIAHNLGFLGGGTTVVYPMLEHGMLHIADASTLEDRSFFVVGRAPLEATPVPGTAQVLVASSAEGRVVVADTAERKPVRSVAAGANPIGAWLASGTRAYVTSESDRVLTRLDGPSWEAGASTRLPGVPGQTVSVAAGEEVWVALEDQGKVLVLAAADLGVRGEITIGKRPHGLAASDDGRFVYLTDERDGRVHELDVASRSVVRSIEVGGEPNGIVFRGPSL